MGYQLRLIKNGLGTQFLTETVALRQWGVQTNVCLSTDLVTKDKLATLIAEVSSVSLDSL